MPQILSFPTRPMIEAHVAALETSGKNYYVAENVREYVDYARNRTHFTQPYGILCAREFLPALETAALCDFGFSYLRTTPIIVIGGAKKSKTESDLNIVDTFDVKDQTDPEKFREVIATLWKAKLAMSTKPAAAELTASKAKKEKRTAPRKPKRRQTLETEFPSYR